MSAPHPALAEMVRRKRDCLTCAFRRPQPCLCGPDAGVGVCGRYNASGEGAPPAVDAWLDTYRPDVSTCGEATAPHSPIQPLAPDCPGWSDHA